MDKNVITWLLTIYTDFDFYLLATPGCKYTQNYTDVILKARRRSKLWKIAQCHPQEKDICTWFERKDKIFQIFLEKYFKKW